jgi:flavin-dependent dehydrogenase
LFDHPVKNRQGSLIITREEEFPYPYHDDRCHLWFFENGLPGYAWYVPKSDGYLNVGIGASAARLQTREESLNAHWSRLVEKLDQTGLVTGHDFQPQGYSYYLRGKAPQIHQGNAFLVGDALGLATRDMGEGLGAAIRSGLQAADAIIYNRPYTISSIPRFSLPSLLRLRR